MSILALAVLRLLWRLLRRPPDLPAAVRAAMPGWQRVAHHGTHLLLYLLFFAVPLVGWAYSSALDVPIVWFGVLPLPDWVAPNPELADVLERWHAWLAWALGVLAALHTVAALKHHWIDRDGLLVRMGWPRSCPRYQRESPSPTELESP